MRGSVVVEDSDAGPAGGDPSGWLFGCCGAMGVLYFFQARFSKNVPLSVHLLRSAAFFGWSIEDVCQYSRV